MSAEFVFSVPVQAFRESLAFVSLAFVSQATRKFKKGKRVALFEHVLLEADGDAIRLSAGNSELFIERTIITPVERGCRFFLSMPMLTFLEGFDDGQVRVEAVDNKIVLSQGTNSATFNDCGPFDTFTPEGDLEPLMGIGVPTVKTVAERLCMAINDENNRFNTGCILLDIRQHEVNFVATCCRRMHVHRHAPPKMDVDLGDGKKEILLSPKALKAAASMPVGFVQVSANQNHVVFSAVHCRIVCEINQGRFPRWENVMDPSRTESVCVCEAGPLLEKLRSAALFLDDAIFPGVDLTLSDGRLLMEGRGKDGIVSVSLPVDYVGKERKTQIDRKYLLSMFAAFPPDAVFGLHIVNNNPMGFTHGDFSAVVMHRSTE